MSDATSAVSFHEQNALMAKMHVLHPQPAGVHGPQSRTVHHGNEQPVMTAQIIDNRCRLFASKHNGQAPPVTGPVEIQLAELNVQDLAIQEHDGVQHSFFAY
ncbi:hypothetical protein [Microbulbifer marinus]|uniref:hypothetical protein n=1 Tax=Microbulbifer marinus TaxID=658218 RepID=UPI001FCD9D93|nr:hypothetical protein [Microbulbifer marinus]